jgi:hypothetical protein
MLRLEFWLLLLLSLMEKLRRLLLLHKEPIRDTGENI